MEKIDAENQNTLYPQQDENLEKNNTAYGGLLQSEIKLEKIDTEEHMNHTRPDKNIDSDLRQTENDVEEIYTKDLITPYSGTPKQGDKLEDMDTDILKQIYKDDPQLGINLDKKSAYKDVLLSEIKLEKVDTEQEKLDENHLQSEGQIGKECSDQPQLGEICVQQSEIKLERAINPPQSEKQQESDQETHRGDRKQSENNVDGDLHQSKKKLKAMYANYMKTVKIIKRQSEKEPKTIDSDSPSVVTKEPLKKGRPRSGKRLHECDICSRSFTKRSNLVTHMRVHTGEKPFVCEVCQKGFTQSSSLITHRRIHTGEQPYGCNICQKRFSESCALTKHKMSHSGVKPYGCKLCEKSFSRNISLTRHMTIHTGEKPFVCSVCNKGFSQNHTLSTHMRSHTGYKPFVCEFCQQAFTQKCNLMSHVRMHTGEKPFVCSVCDKSFRDSSQLSRHAVIHSGLSLMCEVMLTE